MGRKTGACLPTPRVPTRMPKTSASLACWTTAYLRMRRAFVRTDSRRVVFFSGSYACTFDCGVRVSLKTYQNKIK